MSYNEEVRSRFRAEVILASRGIFTYQQVWTVAVTYPRFLLPEVNTHREFSRNTSSSRAIPTAKLIAMVRECPAGPIEWGSNQPGMQAGAPLSIEKQDLAECAWQMAAHKACNFAERLAEEGCHKQIVNRVIEPFVWVTQLITTTNWQNFLALRLDSGAQPEIQFLAELIRDAVQDTTPQILTEGEWHLPYITLGDWDDVHSYLTANGTLRKVPTMAEKTSLLKRISAARCARVSYLTHEGRRPTLEEDLALFNRLAGSQPIHASPLEHQCTPDLLVEIGADSPTSESYEDWANPSKHGNLRGWIQHRKELPGEFFG